MSSLLQKVAIRYNLERDKLDASAPSIKHNESYVVTIDDADANEFDGTLDRLVVGSPFGRYGNNMYQVGVALRAAKLLSIPAVSIADLYGLKLTEEFVYDDISVSPYVTSERKRGASLVGRYFAQDSFGRLYTSISDPALIVHSFENGVRQLFEQNYSLSKEKADQLKQATVLYMRSGDVFRRDRPHPSYGQPPHSYYQLAIEHSFKNFGNTSIIIISEDRLNPCVESVENWCIGAGIPVRTMGHNMVETIETLACAATVVAGVGSFYHATYLVSPFVQNVYVSWLDGKYNSTAKAKNVNLFAAKDLARMYFKYGEWANTDDQRQLMLEYPLESLSLVRLTG